MVWKTTHAEKWRQLKDPQTIVCIFPVICHLSNLHFGKKNVAP